MRIILILITIVGYFLIVGFVIPKNYQHYIDQHLYKAQQLEALYGVPVSIQFAQAIHESGAGQSNIARKANNHFGIRCGDNWQGERYYSSSGCWRKYKTVGLSFVDHAQFIAKYYPKACHKSWKHWRELEGYGGSGYWPKICKTVEKYKLYQYDALYVASPVKN